MTKFDQLDAKTLRGALGESFIGNEIIVLKETTSSNDVVWQLARKGHRAGLVVFAESQTSGRGQRGNRWESAPHLGVWLSILLRPKIEPADSARVVTWAAQNIVATIKEEIGADAQIKLPNDIYIHAKKIAGVLVEMRVEKEGGYAAIVGIGVNVNQSEHDFPEELRQRAGSLAMAAARQIDRQRFAIVLLRNLDESYRTVLAV